MRGLEQVPWFYDAFMALAEAFGLGRWRRRLLAEARGRTLELGCGTGRNLPLYDGAVDSLFALDVHFEVLPAARRRAPETPPGGPVPKRCRFVRVASTRWCRAWSSAASPIPTGGSKRSVACCGRAASC